MTDDNRLARAHRVINQMIETMETLGVVDTELWSPPEPYPGDQVRPAAGNPEDRVLDAIDELVNEQLAHGPVDDYNADRYPDCDRCSHNWHGVKCEYCDCEGSTGEVGKPAVIYPRYRLSAGHPYIEDRGLPYVDQIESVRITDDRGSPGFGRHTYTLADLERMRAELEASRTRHYEGPQPAPEVRLWDGNMVYLGSVEWPVRFYGVPADPDNPEAIEGTLEIAGPSPQWLEALIDQTQRYILATIAEAMGLPAEIVDGIPHYVLSEQLDVHSWFGDEIPELPLELQFPRMLESPVQRARRVIAEQQQLGFDPEAWARGVEHAELEAVAEIEATRERRELNFAIRVGTDEPIDEPICDNDPPRARAPRCPQCGIPMLEVDPADIPEGDIPPACIDCVTTWRID